MPSLTLRDFCFGPWMTNCYVLQVEGSHDCWIIDASFDPAAMIDYIRTQRLSPTQVILTHAHVDHIAGLEHVRDIWPHIPILIHEAERDFPADPALNLSAMLPDPIAAPAPTGVLHHGQKIALAGVELEIRHTPGHSPGGIALIQHQQKIAVVGDTLFAGSIGRSDFPTSDGEVLLRSIHEQLLTLPGETKIYPGHGPATTIEVERRTNPFLQ